jgi:hypothetical protein
MNGFWVWKAANECDHLVEHHNVDVEHLDLAGQVGGLLTQPGWHCPWAEFNEK